MMTHGSLFTGIGGFDLGFEQAGLETKWQVENDESCLRVLDKRWPNVRRFGDVRQVGRHNLESVDVISGGFPCQDLSTSQNGRKGGLRARRSGLFFEAARIIGEFQPKWFVLENVLGLLSSNEGKDIKTVITSLSQCGYCVAWRVLDSKYFGIPQGRRRVFIVGSFGNPSAAKVLFEDFAQVEQSYEKEAPPQTLVPVAINPYQHGSNGIGISRTVHTLDSRPDRIVLAPFDPDGMGDDAGVPEELDKDRYRVLGNAVSVPVASWIGRRLMDSVGN